jgi:hypothetical protein
VTDTFHAAQIAALKAAFARITGADVAAFQSHDLTITTRPEPSYWPFSALIVGFGTGTVACFDEKYVEWAREQPPQPYDRAGYMVIPLAREAEKRGETIHAMPPMMGWALAREPIVPALPAGLRMERMDASWMNDFQQTIQFTNALGEASQAHRRFRNKYAFVVFDEANDPVAAAGAFDTSGLSEIGVDVKREHQGLGLAPAVVSAAARAILDDGGIPYYACAVTNIRSQRTALASGFVPACSDAIAMSAGMGLD